MYVRATDTGPVYPYTATDLIRSRPDVSWPAGPLPDSLLAEYGVYPVRQTAPPAFDPATQTVVQDGAEQLQGEWFSTWSVVQLTPEQIAAKNADQANVAREQRNQKLKDCDWTQLADSPVNKAAWAIYRQALRDVPQQAEFPWNIQWPNQPV